MHHCKGFIHLIQAENTDVAALRVQQEHDRLDANRLAVHAQAEQAESILLDRHRMVGQGINQTHSSNG